MAIIISSTSVRLISRNKKRKRRKAKISDTRRKSIKKILSSKKK